MIRQRTLRNPIGATGIGLHTGESASLRLVPAPVDTGILFRRIDRSPVVDIPVNVQRVVDAPRSTTLAAAGCQVAMVEHLLAALAAFGIDNLIVELGASELPIMDGSAGPLVFLIQSAGIAEQNAPKRFLRVRRAVTVEAGDHYAGFYPYEGFRLSVSADAGDPTPGQRPSRLSIDLSPEAFARQVSRARSRGFLERGGAPRGRGAARGGRSDRATMDDEGVEMASDLRYPDEFLRHQMLVAIGDLYLLGHNLIGEYRADDAGHRLSGAAVRALLGQRDAWEMVSFDDPATAPMTYFSGPSTIAA